MIRGIGLPPLWRPCGLLVCLASPAFAVPRLVLDKERHSFGDVYQGTMAEHRFRISNAGDGPLVISLVRSSCAPCTISTLDNRPIPSGGHRWLTLSYHAKGSLGRHTAAVFIHSNDAAAPVRRLAVDLNIVEPTGVPRLRCEPAKVDLGVVGVEASQVASLVLSNARDAKGPLRIAQAHSSPTCEPQIKLPLSLAPGQERVVTVKVTPDTPGVVQEQVTFVSNDPITPMVSVPISGYARAGDTSTGRDPAHGLVIEAVGDPVLVAGSGGRFCRRLRLTNGTEGPVHVSFPSGPESTASAVPGDLLLRQGQTQLVRLELLGERVGKSRHIRIEVRYPAVILEGRKLPAR